MAPNFSKFYDDALKEGLGLVEFIELHHPGEADLKEIKPKMDMPHKGYFPSGKICKIFEKDFFRWTDAIGKYKKHQKLIDLIVRRLNRTHGLSLTKADLIVSGSGSAPGSNAGGGYSWIHPRLMTHFLQWCCPEFAEEVLDVFQRYLSGDPDLISQSVSIRATTLENELQAANDNLVEKDQLLSKRESELQQLQRLIDTERDTLQTKLQDVAAHLELLKTEDNERYQSMAREYEAKQEAMSRVLEDKDVALANTEELLERDPCRPCNIFRDMDKDDIPQSNRHTQIQLWFPARHITTDACIFFANNNYDLFMVQVVRGTEKYDLFAKSKLKWLHKMLHSKDLAKRNKGRRAVMKMYRELSVNAKESVGYRMYEEVVDQFQTVFNCTPDDKDFKLKAALNNVTMYAMLCRCLKYAYGVDYSTEIETKYLAKMAANFNDYAGEDYAIPLGPDYSDVIANDNVELLVYP